MAAPPVFIHEERHASGRVLSYTVTCGRFTAYLPACLRDECASGDLAGSLKECTIPLDHRHQHTVKGSKGVDAWLRHSRTHCHGYHRGRAQAFADTVAKTYGSHKPCTPERARGRLKARPVGSLKPEAVAELLDITVDEYRAELAKAAA